MCVLHLSILTATPALAQVTKAPYQEDEYPFTLALSVASENVPSPFGIPVVFVGVGAGAWSIDASTSTQPVHFQPLPGDDRRLFLAGLARKMAIHRGLSMDRLYVASGFGGLDSFDLSTTALSRDVANGFPWEPAAQTAGDAIRSFSVAAVDVNNERYVFVGTNDTLVENGGRIYLVHDKAMGGGLTEIASFNAKAPVHALAARTDLVTDKVSLIAGTACAGKASGCGTGCGDLLRFDIPNNRFNGQPMALAQYVTATLSKPKGLFVRDIEILRAGPVTYAFVATHGRGVRRINVTAAGQLDDQVIPGTGASDSWPALVSTPGVDVRPTSVTIVEAGAGTFLAVGLGRQFVAEHQNFGDCWNTAPCDGTAANPNRFGVRILGDITSQNGPTLRGVFPKNGGTAKDAIQDVSAREGMNGEVWVDAAGVTNGYRLIRFDPSTPAPTASVTEDGSLDDGLLSISVDDLCIVDFPGSSELYVTTESSLVRLGDIRTASTTSGNQLAAAPAGAQYGSGPNSDAVWIESQQDWKWVFAGTSSVAPGTRGVRLFDVNNVDPIYRGLIDNGGFTNLCFAAVDAPAVTAAFPGPSGSPQKWLFAINNTDDQSPLKRAGIRVWDITDVIAGTALPSAAPLRAQYVEYPGPLPFPLSLGDTSRNFGDITVVPLDANTHVVYVLFGPRGPSGGLPAEDSIGLMVFTMTVSTTAPGGRPTYRLELLDKFDALPAGGLSPGGSHPLRAHWDPATHRLYAAYSCYGSVIYEFASGLLSAPTVQYRGSNGRTAYQIAPTNTPFDNVYVAYLHGEIDVIPRVGFATATAVTMDLARYPNQLIPDPNPSSAPGSFYLANGAAGVRRVQLE